MAARPPNITRRPAMWCVLAVIGLSSSYLTSALQLKDATFSASTTNSRNLHRNKSVSAASSKTADTLLHGPSSSPMIAIGTLKSMLEQMLMKYKTNKLEHESEKKLQKRQIELKIKLKDQEGLEQARIFQKNENRSFEKEQYSIVGTCAISCANKTLFQAIEQLEPGFVENEENGDLVGDFKVMKTDYPVAAVGSGIALSQVLLEEAVKRGKELLLEV
ncbi:unnamed protein product [Amoebophrya sp. A120]|nr:unnamed protein product [Amoebophrya sp. A120]|eukprot:GSA120T00007218001.1